MPSWVIAGTLARSQRPGYSGERGQAVPPDAVATWLDAVKAMGVRSIVCLLAEDQLVWHAYQALPKPVLVHCSASVDRTGQAVEHIRGRLGMGADAS